MNYLKKKDKIMSDKKFKIIHQIRGVNIDTSVFFLIKYQLPDSCLKNVLFEIFIEF